MWPIFVIIGIILIGIVLCMSCEPKWSRWYFSKTEYLCPMCQSDFHLLQRHHLTDVPRIEYKCGRCGVHMERTEAEWKIIATH